MKDSIDKIVSTYNLPPRIKSLVLRVANRNLERLGLTSFDDQYRHIADLVERFQLPYEDEKAVRLDSPLFNDGRTWHDILPARSAEEEDEGLTLCESVGTAYSFLSERQREIQLRLLSGSDKDGTTYLTVDDVVADFLGIKWRSKEVVRLLEEDPRFRQPERRLVYVKLDDSPYFKWGIRDYKGKPINFFNRHFKVYKRFLEEGRFAFSKFDPGLYRALTRYAIRKDNRIIKQIELAIPEVKVANTGTALDYEEQTRIIEAYTRYNGNVNEATRGLNHKHPDRTHSIGTISKYWRRAGLEIRRVGAPRISEEDETRIVEAYKTCNGYTSKAVKLLQFCHLTIKKYWRKNNLKPKR